MRIGVDLGGTKIEAIAISATGDEIARKRIETPKGDYNAVSYTHLTLPTILRV